MQSVLKLRELQIPSQPKGQTNVIQKAGKGSLEVPQEVSKENLRFGRVIEPQ